MFKLKIETHNQAFEEYAAEEVARILEEAIIKLRGSQEDGQLLDLNGNVVGHYKLTKR